MGGPDAIVLSRWQHAREAYRSKDLRQAMYDEGAVIMEDCLLVLHGEAHRRRRRVENRLFRREVFAHWERRVLHTTLAAVLAPHVAAGRADLRALGYRAAISLTATIAGVDHDPADERHTSRLEEFVRAFSAGATLAHSTRDRDDVRRDVRAQLRAFRSGMLGESLDRRRELLARLDAGEIAEDDLPRDVATLLLAHQQDLHISPAAIEREICFYLQAGAHSTADAYTHALDELFRRAAAHPEDLAAALADPAFAQRCVHESLRLNPASPVAWRQPLRTVQLRDGTLLPEGSRVVIDLASVNRDPAVWGPDAGKFNPHRPVPEGANAWGLSFGAGAHACIGAELDGGMELLNGAEPGDDHLYGTVAVMVAATLAAGGGPDPANPPVQDPNTQRPHFSSYPIVFAKAQEQP
ncbi:MAG: cytochrome P450 [Acidimicrobiia bacterium]|nr:cytochrome P450 [Acidimicrobiia bacterium]